MIAWIKHRWIEIILVLAIAVILVITTVYVWFRLTHTCIAWEATPTGSYCAQYHTTTISNGKTTSSSTSCIRYETCRRCINWVKDDSPEIPAELVIPADRCP